jgi:hypothetical protein
VRRLLFAVAVLCAACGGGAVPEPQFPSEEAEAATASEVAADGPIPVNAVPVQTPAGEAWFDGTTLYVECSEAFLMLPAADLPEGAERFHCL